MSADETHPTIRAYEAMSEAAALTAHPASAPPMSTDETREALAAMVREGKAAGMYADGHGSAGFCTDHGQAADRPTSVAEAVKAGARALHERVAHWEADPPAYRMKQAAAVLEAVGYAALAAAVARVEALADDSRKHGVVTGWHSQVHTVVGWDDLWAALHPTEGGVR